MLEEIKNDVVADMSQPDAEKPPEPQTQPRKRGRPSKNKGEGVQSSRKSTLAPDVSQADFEAGAKGLNTGIFILACSITGSAKAWPDDEKQKMMDKALTRYLEVKNKIPPAEIALLVAYGGWLKQVSTDPEIKVSTENRFGGKLAKIKNLFKKKGQIQ